VPWRPAPPAIRRARVRKQSGGLFSRATALGAPFELTLSTRGILRGAPKIPQGFSLADFCLCGNFLWNFKSLRFYRCDLIHLMFSADFPVIA
jgi:hypothetical protein